MKILGWTVIFLLMVGMGATLGWNARQPEPQRAMYRTDLVIPVPCLDALDHGDDLLLLLGESIAVAARREREVDDLVRRATLTTEDYQASARRCRSLR